MKNYFISIVFIVLICSGQNIIYPEDKHSDYYKKFSKANILYYYYQRENFYRDFNGKGLFLNMHDIPTLTSIKGLSEHRPDLRELNIRNCPIENISELSKMKKLRSVTLLGTRVKDISPLQKVISLKSFKINTPIKNLELLPNNLKHLFLGESIYLDVKDHLEKFKENHPNTKIVILEKY